jgi:hypothetical protein
VKLATFSQAGSTRIGVVVGDEVVDLAAAAPEMPRAMEAFLAAGAPALERARAAVRGGPRLPLASVAGGAGARAAQVPGDHLNRRHRSPRRVGPHRNSHVLQQAGHLRERPVRTDPYAGSSSKLDYEGELAFVIGKRCRHVPKERAREVIAGTRSATMVQRDWQQRCRP